MCVCVCVVVCHCLIFIAFLDANAGTIYIYHWIKHCACDRFWFTSVIFAYVLPMEMDAHGSECMACVLLFFAPYEAYGSHSLTIHMFLTPINQNKGKVHSNENNMNGRYLISSGPKYTRLESFDTIAPNVCMCVCVRVCLRSYVGKQSFSLLSRALCFSYETRHDDGMKRMLP